MRAQVAAPEGGSSGGGSVVGGGSARDDTASSGNAHACVGCGVDTHDPERGVP